MDRQERIHYKSVKFRVRYAVIPGARSAIDRESVAAGYRQDGAALGIFLMWLIKFFVLPTTRLFP
jgi:hypothetical protein